MPNNKKSKESEFREWLVKTIKQNGFYPYKEAINSGAELFDCSPLTTKKYVDKLISNNGPLARIVDYNSCIHDFSLVFKADLLKTK